MQQHKFDAQHEVKVLPRCNHNTLTRYCMQSPVSKNPSAASKASPEDTLRKYQVLGTALTRCLARLRACEQLSTAARIQPQRLTSGRQQPATKNQAELSHLGSHSCEDSCRKTAGIDAKGGKAGQPLCKVCAAGRYRVVSQADGNNALAPMQGGWVDKKCPTTA